MSTQYVVMPLFDDALYSYDIALQDVSYVVSFQYNERASQWFFTLMDANSEPIVASMALSPLYPIALDYAIYPLTGFFWLEPIADIDIQQYKLYPDKINQYYRMFYIYESED